MRFNNVVEYDMRLRYHHNSIEYTMGDYPEGASMNA